MLTMRCREALASTQIVTPRIPVVSNVDAQPHSDPDTINDILARQVCAPLIWLPGFAAYFRAASA